MLDLDFSLPIQNETKELQGAWSLTAMGTSVQVTPLCGVYNESPLSYLVSVDGFNFLIGCGWNAHFDPALLQPLFRVASTIDAVLISHPDTFHLGVLPYAMKQLGLSAPVYSTEPVYRLGLLTMYDQFIARKQVSEFDLFTLDDIDSAFQVVTRLTYSQNHHLSAVYHVAQDALRCGEYVIIRKVADASQKGGGSGTQQVVIEGPLCEDNYKILSVICYSLSVISRDASLNMENGFFFFFFFLIILTTFGGRRILGKRFSSYRM